MTNLERIQSHNTQLADIIETAETLPDKTPIAEGEIEITENGEYDVAQFAIANVDVPIPDGYIIPTGIKDIVENGEHDVKDFEKVNVNVQSGDDSGTTADTIVEGGYAEINLPNATSIKQYAFYMDDTLVNISMPNVESIGNSAFSGCMSLALTELPDTLVIIESYAFSDCSGLTNITLPASVTSIGENAFSYCYNVTIITILAEEPPTLGSDALYGMDSLTLIRVPASSVDAYKSADGWSDYADIIVGIGEPMHFTVTGENLDKIGYTGEENENLIIPETFQDSDGTLYKVTAIDGSAFNWCEYLASVTIPASVTYMGSYIFDGCYNLTTITVLAEEPPTLDYSLGDPPLTEIRVPGSSVNAYKAADGWIDYADLIVGMGDHTPYTVTLTTNISSAGTVEFTSDGHSGTSVELIGKQILTFSATCNSDYRFLGWYVGDTLISTDAVYTEGYTIWGETTIEARFKSIYTSFQVDSSDRNKIGYTGVENEKLIIPRTFQDSNGTLYKVTRIGEHAFYNCDNLISVTIPDSVVYITNPFDDCDNLRTITVLAETPPTLMKTLNNSSSSSALIAIRVPANAVNAYKAANGWKDYANIIIAIGEAVPFTVTNRNREEVGYKGDENENLVIPETFLDSDGTLYKITAIGIDAFFYHENLASVIIPGSVISISDNAFGYCTGLTNVTFGDNSQLTTIGYSAFCNCEGLTSITIPDSVTSIGEEAFYLCDNITTITILSETPPTLGSDALPDIDYSLTTIRVPATSIDAYKTSEGWNEYADIIVAIGGNS